MLLHQSKAGLRRTVAPCFSALVLSAIVFGSSAVTAFVSQRDGSAPFLKQTRPRPEASLENRRFSSEPLALFATRNADQASAVNPGASGPLFAVSTFGPETSGQSGSWLDSMLSGYMGPRLVLGAIAAMYATNFPLGSLMADNLPSPAAATCARMVLAGLALSPQILNLKASYRVPAMLIGCFTTMGYITQSMALVDTNPATVSFLGAATVLVCPFLEWALDKKPMSLREAPQTWLAALLCIMGVGALELCGGGGASGGFAEAFSNVGAGDGLALLQAVGFGTQVYLSEKLIRDEPEQAMPVTATLIGTTALLSSIWCYFDGWMASTPHWQDFALPGLLLNLFDNGSSLQMVAAAVAWTGLVSTAFNFSIEMAALGRVSPAEASVILATEPLWAALFASTILGQQELGMNDYVGGGLIVAACLANSLKPSDFDPLFGNAEG